MHTKYILLLSISLFFVTSCSESEKDSSEKEDTTWRDKSAREKLDSMKFSPVVEKVSRKIDGIDDRINSVMLVVNYDDEGNMWLTGMGASNKKKVKTVSELSDLLSMVVLKGDAGVSYAYDKATHKGKVPAGNLELEEMILTELRKQGFSEL